jgi:hypothetical protein
MPLVDQLYLAGCIIAFVVFAGALALAGTTSR